MSNVLRETIGSSLYAKRMEYGFTQEQMAAKCCVSNRQYNDLENGKRLPGLKTFINIVIVCDLDVNSIIKTLIGKGYKITDDRNAV
ncbi:MAG: helix-turn-helix transcriptional regulator [Clostridia bacterium]|nr:helix-turn-helix transcriptional regulator [Clostridia bacterium]